MLFDQLQRFTQLQHGRKFMLAVVAAETGANQSADYSVAVFELHLIAFAAFHNGIALGAVDADISDLVLHVVIMATLGDRRCDVDPLEIIQMECGVIAAADERILFAGPCNLTVFV